MLAGKTIICADLCRRRKDWAELGIVSAIVDGYELAKDMCPS
jgi:hypothetical protein